MMGFSYLSTDAVYNIKGKVVCYLLNQTGREKTTGVEVKMHNVTSGRNMLKPKSYKKLSESKYMCVSCTCIEQEAQGF